MSFLGLASGDFGGETSSPDYTSPSGVIGIDSGNAPTPSDPGSGGTFLNELGSFTGIITSGIANITRSLQTPPLVGIPRTTNVPSSSLQRVAQTQGGSLLIWVLIGLALVFGIKYLRK